MSKMATIVMKSPISSLETAAVQSGCGKPVSGTSAICLLLKIEFDVEEEKEIHSYLS